MKLALRIPTPTPHQRASTWAFNASWEVFGNWHPGMPDWSIMAREDGTITASDGNGTYLDLGTWKIDADDNLEIFVEHEYPTSHD